MENLPHRLSAEAVLAAQLWEQARVDDRGRAAARAANDGDDIGRRALADLLDKVVDEPIPAEEEARVLLTEGQEAAIGCKPSEQLFRRGSVDRFSSRAGDEALETFGFDSTREYGGGDRGRSVD